MIPSLISPAREMIAPLKWAISSAHTRNRDSTSRRCGRSRLGEPVRDYLRGGGPPDAAGARRSSSSSICPVSTPVRICRATLSSSATCVLVSE